jgi:hypothetical protein
MFLSWDVFGKSKGLLLLFLPYWRLLMCSMRQLRSYSHHERRTWLLFSYDRELCVMSENHAGC